jgi:hypothetical protein
VTQPQAAVLGLLDQIEKRAPDIGAGMAEAILKEVEPMRAVSRNDPDFRRRFDGFCRQHVLTFINTTREDRVAQPGDLEFVRAVAARRADDAFPLPELMEGLRIGHRVFSRWIAQLGSGWDTPAAAVLWLSNRLVDYQDAAGTALADSYRTRQRLSAGLTQLARREMLDDILEGRYAGRPDAALLAASIGFEPDGQYCVVVLTDSSETHSTQELATEVTHAAFSGATFRFVVVRGDEVVAVFRATEAQAVVAQATGAHNSRPRGHQARAGLSTACRGIAEVARGYWEAVRALRFASASEPCIDLRKLGPLRYLEFSADSVARRLASECAGPLVAPRCAALAETVLAYVECGLNVRATATRMGVHLNTVHNRLERVADMLHRSELSPLEALEVATAIRICRSSAAL